MQVEDPVCSGGAKGIFRTTQLGHTVLSASGPDFSLRPPFFLPILGAVSTFAEAFCTSTCNGRSWQRIREEKGHG